MYRKMTDNDWTIRVLEKLGKLIRDGYMKSFVGWSYDSDTNKEDENRALLRLETEKVVTVWTDESGAFLPDEHGVLVTGEDTFGAYELTTGNIKKGAVVGNLNTVEFKRLSSDYGIDTTNELYKASLEIKGFGTPVVSIGGKKYVFNSLQAGKKKEALINAISKHPERVLTLKNIVKVSGLEETTNLNKLLENSLFVADEPLVPFLTLTKDSVTFHSERLLTIEQVDAIKSGSKSS
jgi:hypothetical protein